MVASFCGECYFVISPAQSLYKKYKQALQLFRLPRSHIASQEEKANLLLGGSCLTHGSRDIIRRRELDNLSIGRSLSLGDGEGFDGDKFNLRGRHNLCGGTMDDSTAGIRNGDGGENGGKRGERRGEHCMIPFRLPLRTDT
jgi:hypothetical protein